jgi:rhodanese-related sulfurtransferase
MKKGYQQLVDEATHRSTYSVAEALTKLDKGDVQFIDVRDIRELEREGVVPGAFHAPRGMIEFWVDPDSPYFKPVFGEKKEFILFCAAGWRSALTTKTLWIWGWKMLPISKADLLPGKAAGAPVYRKKENSQYEQKASKASEQRLSLRFSKKV